MRLIDADALLENVKRGVYTDDLSTTIAVDICKSHIEKMSTIDAIPVEWLREKMRGYASSLKSTETAALVMVMQMWQKEQEGV